ncbi:MAG TPA: IreB family regulatory phosphoprotein [Clostridia bacterium]|nr:IreB family regulatory phosphoprotein [Clostridia bacterium]
MNSDETLKFARGKENYAVREIFDTVYNALSEKGYDPVNQIVGYIISGDPTYITGHNNARSLIRRIERDELLEELVRSYTQKSK